MTLTTEAHQQRADESLKALLQDTECLQCRCMATPASVVLVEESAHLHEMQQPRMDSRTYLTQSGRIVHYLGCNSLPIQCTSVDTPL